ncbi:MAG: 2-enoyl thioester reductase domain-containing protein [Chthoniobacterales bacterium]|nr:2-enoyl thioester reductase domain-containing protein [Chthoniobacterales bacterium]
MNRTTRLSARLESFGTPPALRVIEEPLPSPAPGQLLLQMLAAPINPADINILEGKYGELPDLPAYVGNEGVGKVLAIGEGVTGWQISDLALPMCRGTWQSHLLTNASDAIALPTSLDTNQASMLTVNPATAFLLLKEIVPLTPGEWIIQNAANSGVGQCVIQIAKQLGLHVISIVRREELVEPLRTLGSDEVLLDSADLKSAIPSICGKNRPRLGLNSVGGQSALDLANCLANGGTLVTFGAMSRQPLKIPNGLLIFRDIRFIGFWLTRWLKTASREQKQTLYSQLAQWASEGKLYQPVATTYPLQDVFTAIEAAQAERRNGKILLTLSLP